MCLSDLIWESINTGKIEDLKKYLNMEKQFACDLCLNPSEKPGTCEACREANEVTELRAV